MVHCLSDSSSGLSLKCPVPHARYFKTREAEKALHRPRGDGDNESVDDVDDDEFEKLLGKFKDSEMNGYWSKFRKWVNVYQTSGSSLVDSSLVAFSPYPDSYEGDSYFTDLPIDETDLDFAG